MPDLILLSGGRGTGKTTLCQAVVGSARQAGWRVAGVLSPALIEGGRKVAIEVEDLSSGERRLLARLPVGAGDMSRMRTPGWEFDDRGLQWGNDALARAVNCDLLVIDELGPLELGRGQGWTHGMIAIEKGAYRLALVVIRPELLSNALERWRMAELLELKCAQEAPAALEKITRFWNPPDVHP